MRITNKRLILGIIRALIREGERRDRKLSKILRDQFHAIGLGPLTSILHEIGFTRLSMEPAPPVISWTQHRTTHAAYLASDIAARLSFGTVNLAPGILLFAETS